MDEFCYRDPIDQSVSKNQGIRILFTDGSRIVFRLSGTAGSGATIRMYLEKYQSPSAPEKLYESTETALSALVHIALSVSEMQRITGFASPTVIT